FCAMYIFFIFFFQAEDGIRDFHVTGVQTCALPILEQTKNAVVIFTNHLTEDTDILNPKIVYANDGFLELTKTKIEDVLNSGICKIGRASCRERGKIEMESSTEE